MIYKPLTELIWVFSKIGVPPKWMVYNGKPYFLMDDLGIPLLLETPISSLYVIKKKSNNFDLQVEKLRVSWSRREKGNVFWSTWVGIFRTNPEMKNMLCSSNWIMKPQIGG